MIYVMPLIWQATLLMCCRYGRGAGSVSAIQTGPMWHEALSGRVYPFAYRSNCSRLATLLIGAADNLRDDVFMKVGASSTVRSRSFYRFDGGGIDLGDYEHLRASLFSRWDGREHLALSVRP